MNEKLVELLGRGFVVEMRYSVDPKHPEYAVKLRSVLFDRPSVVGRCDTLELALSNAIRMAKDEGWL